MRFADILFLSIPSNKYLDHTFLITNLQSFIKYCRIISVTKNSYLSLSQLRLGDVYMNASPYAAARMKVFKKTASYF